MDNITRAVCKAEATAEVKAVIGMRYCDAQWNFWLNHPYWQIRALIDKAISETFARKLREAGIE